MSHYLFKIGEVVVWNPARAERDGFAKQFGDGPFRVERVGQNNHEATGGGHPQLVSFNDYRGHRRTISGAMFLPKS